METTYVAPGEPFNRHNSLPEFKSNRQTSGEYIIIPTPEHNYRRIFTGDDRLTWYGQNWYDPLSIGYAWLYNQVTSWRRLQVRSEGTFDREELWAAYKAKEFDDSFFPEHCPICDIVLNYGVGQNWYMCWHFREHRPLKYGTECERPCLERLDNSRTYSLNNTMITCNPCNRHKSNMRWYTDEGLNEEAVKSLPYPIRLDVYKAAIERTIVRRITPVVGLF